MTILSDGRVQQGTDQAGQISVVRPASLGDLVRLGENMFRSLGELTPLTETTVKSGFVETSAVSATTEMMEPIETSFAYEANVKMIQNQDHMTGELLSRILRQS